MSNLQSALSEVGVIALFAAARATGFRVGRNGEHTKGSLITALCAGTGEAGRKVLSHLGLPVPPSETQELPQGDTLPGLWRVVRGKATGRSGRIVSKHESKYKPGEFYYRLEDSHGVFFADVAAVIPADKPEPAPVPASQSSEQPKMTREPIPADNAESVLSNAIRAIAGQSVNEEKVREIAEDVAETSIRAAIDSGLIGNSGPTYVQFPAAGNSPEFTFDHLTHWQLPRLRLRVELRHNVWLVGGAGAGKTTVAREVAQSLGLKFYAQSAVSFGHDLLGYMQPQLTGPAILVRTPFRDAWEFGGAWLLDDAMGSAAEALLVVNMGLSNSHCAFPDGLIERHPDFVCVIGDNTDGSGATMQFAGRARQDGAFIDRFTMIDWQIDPRIEELYAVGKATSPCPAQLTGTPWKGCEPWLAAVRAVRQFIADKGIQDVAATPRAVIRGSQALRAGEHPLYVLEGELKRGALRKQWAEIERLPAVQEFLELATGF